MMKKYLHLFLLISLISSCGDDEIPVIPDPINPCLVEIDIPSDYLTSNDTYTLTGHLFITDMDGNLIADGVLENGNTTCLEAGAGSIVDKFDITFYIRYQFADKAQHYFNTFVNSGKTKLEFSALGEFPEPFNEDGRIFITDTESHLDNILNGNAGTGSSSISSSSFETELDFSMRTTPYDVYFSFQHRENGQYGYIWKPDVLTSFEETISYPSLPIIPAPLEINYPNNDSLIVSIFGFTADNTPSKKKLSEEKYTSGSQISTHYYPEDLFEGYEVNTLLRTNGTRYTSKQFTDEIASNFEIPNMDFEIINNNFPDFQISTSGDYEFYNLGFRYEDVVEDYVIRWNFHGIEISEVDINLPQIDIATITNQDDFQLNYLTKQETRISIIDGVDALKEYIYLRLDYSRVWDSDIGYYRAER